MKKTLTAAALVLACTPCQGATETPSKVREPEKSKHLHESAHCLQFFTKGLRDFPYVGWSWESNAEWMTHQMYYTIYRFPWMVEIRGGRPRGSDPAPLAKSTGRKSDATWA
jgi:hypothetical protein